MAIIHTIAIDDRPHCIFCRRPLSDKEIKRSVEPDAAPHCLEQENKKCQYCDWPCRYVVALMGVKLDFDSFVFVCKNHVYVCRGTIAPSV